MRVDFFSLNVSVALLRPLGKISSFRTGAVLESTCKRRAFPAYTPQGEGAAERGET